jgi:EAL domain-containing protein (putative c-di-GMP-specific phosphodiesterase class I)
VVGEGVESAAQARALRDIGCDAMQGFFYGDPGPPERLWDDGERSGSRSVVSTGS